MYRLMARASSKKAKAQAKGLADGRGAPVAGLLRGDWDGVVISRPKKQFERKRGFWFTPPSPTGYQRQALPVFSS